MVSVFCVYCMDVLCEHLLVYLLCLPYTLFLDGSSLTLLWSIISTMVASLPAYWPLLTRTTRPTSTNLQLEALTVVSVDIFGVMLIPSNQIGPCWRCSKSNFCYGWKMSRPKLARPVPLSRDCLCVFCMWCTGFPYHLGANRYINLNTMTRRNSKGRGVLPWWETYLVTWIHEYPTPIKWKNLRP